MTLQAPFPWFGGKRKAAPIVWERLGAVQNYVEPFFGSGAALLARPQPFAGPETINDACGFVANFWRAIQADPDAVAAYADWPVNEADLAARHYWLVTEGREALARVLGDPEGFDAKIAGWWCWGLCAWIGGGWCSGEGPWQWAGGEWVRDAGQGINRQLPHVGDAGQGINRKLPHVGDGQGINRKLPHVGDAGQGINRKLPHVGDGQGINRKLPHVGDGQGINRQLPHVGNAGQGINRQLPHVGNAGRGINRQLPHVGNGQGISEWFAKLAERLRRVRVAHGDWSRVTGDTVTWRHGLTGVFLDPPYGEGRTDGIYATDDLTVAAKAREWALDAGKRPDMRICLAGYDGEHDMPGWSAVRWKARGGYGSQGEGRGRENAARETLWFSPHCLAPTQATLF